MELYRVPNGKHTHLLIYAVGYGILVDSDGSPIGVQNLRLKNKQQNGSGENSLEILGTKKSENNEKKNGNAT